MQDELLVKSQELEAVRAKSSDLEKEVEKKDLIIVEQKRMIKRIKVLRPTS